MTARKAEIGPTRIKKIPPFLKAFWSIIPVANAMALGGVDTGKSNEREQLMATITGTATPKGTDAHSLRIK